MVTTATTGREQQEAAVALVGFDDEVVALAEPRGGASLIDAAADDERGVEMRRGEDRSDDRCGRRLAVRTGDGDAVFQPHQFGEHFRARNDRNLVFVRFDDFRIVGL